MSATLPSLDPDATSSGGLFLDLAAARQQVTMPELLERLTALFRSCEGCEAVTVIGAYRLDIVDRRDGCNWSLSLLLDPAGVAPEVYGAAYASVIATARERWNLDDVPGETLEPDFVL